MKSFPEKFTGGAVGQVPALGEIEREEGVARLRQREVGRHVGLRAAVGLDVGGLGAEELLRAVDRQLLDDVDHTRSRRSSACPG